jgi:hypothetical protein
MSAFTQNPKQLRSYFVKGLLVSLGVAGLMGIVALLSGEFGMVQGKILLTTLLVGIYSMLCLCCLTLAGKRYEVVALLGVIFSSAALVLGLALVWIIFGDWEVSWPIAEFIWKMFYITGVVGFSLAHQSLLLLLADRPHALVQRLLWYTIIAITAVAAMLIYPVMEGFDLVDEFYWRLLGVLAILDVVGTIATPVIAKLQSQSQPKSK